MFRSVVAPPCVRAEAVIAVSDEARRRTQGGTLVPYDWFIMHPDLAVLRGDPRFRPWPPARELRPRRCSR